MYVTHRNRERGPLYLNNSGVIAGAVDGIFVSATMPPKLNRVELLNAPWVNDLDMIYGKA
jgi:hypothetical protein